MSSLTGITEMEDLTLFVQEKVQEFDSAIDTTTGSDFYNSVIQPLLSRLGPDPYNTSVREFILGRLTVEFPELVLQDGEPIDDYAVKIMQILLEPFRRQIQQVSNNQSLADPTILNEREADSLGANYFVRRRPGGTSVGVARLYFSAPQGAIITPNNAVLDGSGHRFFPVENQAISSSNMLFNIEDNLYFFDIIVRAETEGAAYNISPNSLTGIEELPLVVKVTNKSQFEEGGDKETTIEYLERVENSLTEKSLVTFRGINARLTDVFESIRLIQVIGHGDPEMNRDILTGESDKPAPYSFFIGDSGVGAGPQIDLTNPTNSLLTMEGVQKDTFFEVSAKVGDLVVYSKVSFPSAVSEHTITEVGTQSIQVTPDIAGGIAGGNFFLARAQASITISDIPGGILQPTTLAGEIVVNANEVHLGGTVDVFIRAGAPIQRDTVLEGVLDGSPLHFGVDLESFGERDEEFIHITPRLTNHALRPSTDRFGNAVTDHILIRQYDLVPMPLTGGQNDGATVVSTGTFNDADAVFITDGVIPGATLKILSGADAGEYSIISVNSETQLTVAASFSASAGSLNYTVTQPVVPWKPSDEDVGRFIQILDGGPQGLLEILEVKSDEYYSNGGAISPPIRVTRIKVGLTNQERPLVTYVLNANDATFDTDFRIVEKIGTKNRVRDRDGTRLVHTSPDVPSGFDLGVIGAVVGDSVVIETGDDAGIYSIRRIVDWLDTGDTLLLDRDLTKNVTPTGTGDASGLRYRIADELNVDLVAPKVTKIPLGSVFSGDDLSTVASSSQVLVTGSTNFLLAGVEAGDVLEILEGDDKGTYSVVSVTGTTAELDAELLNTSSQLEFTVYRSFAGVERPMVRVKEIELLDSSSQPTGIKIPYGDAVDARALGVFSNRAEGVQQESFTGQTQVGTGTLDIRLFDANVDFVAEGVVPGFRLNILNTGNEGRYTIKKIGTGDGLPTNNHIEVEVPTNGGTEWVELISGVHYTVGLPSAGVARIYFQEPTTVEILTGLAGGRINFETSGATPKEYMFSRVDGFRILPAEGSEETRSRDIRVVRNYETTTPDEFESILELTDPAGPGVLDLEVRVGDVLEVNEQLPFRRTGGSTFAEIGVFGKPAGLRTIAGSNKVTVPSSSLIDFSAMNTSYPLVGQLLFIDEGPDAGEYVIEEVVNSKTLRLNKLMTASTETIVLQDGVGSRDATLAPGVSSVTMTDSTDNPGTQIGNFITIFESTRGDIDSTFEIKSIPGASQVEIDMDPGTFQQVNYVAGDIIPFATGLFSWVNTSGDTNIGHAFRIYKTVPTQAEVLQVATKRTDLNLKNRGDVTSSTVFQDTAATFVTSGVVAGDRLEILIGSNLGVYPIASVDSETQVTIVNNTLNLFPATGANNPYRIWGGLHGSKTMITVGKFESDDGQIDLGEMAPFRLIRPGVFRVSSTAMNENFDGSFYFVDIQVESLGSGDEFNLDRNDRMVVKSGMLADGYTYTVGNNNLTFSPFEEVSLNFDRRFLPTGNSDSPENMTEVSGRNLKVIYETSTTAKLVHDLMRSDSERPINANPLGRHFLPSYVFCQLIYRGGSPVDEVGPTIEDYINNLGAQDELEISDLEAFITKRGATSIEHPITLAVVTHDIDRALVVNRTENRLGGKLEVPYNGTGRISCFFATLDEGLKVDRQS